MKPFEEAMRYDYPLTKSSLVLDAGAHKGDFAAGIAERYDCEIWMFEPLAEFNRALVERFGPVNPKMLMFPYGLGSVTRTETFTVKGNMSGMYADQGPKEQVAIVGIDTVMRAVKERPIDLFKINIEGGEYELLEEMIAHGHHLRCRNIQVQMHDCVRDCVKREAKIRAALLETHEITYDAPFCWTNYRLK